MTWTDEEVAKLKTLWGKGLTATEVGIQIGKGRNAIIGKVFRLGLPARVPAHYHQRSTKRTEGLVRKQKKAPSASGVLAVERAIFDRSGPRKNQVMGHFGTPTIPADSAQLPPYHGPSKPGGIQLIDLESHQCKFAISDHEAREHKFCGCNTTTGLPYCEHHAAVAYRPIDLKARRTFIPRSSVPRSHLTIIDNVREFEAT